MELGVWVAMSTSRLSEVICLLLFLAAVAANSIRWRVPHVHALTRTLEFHFQSPLSSSILLFFFSSAIYSFRLVSIKTRDVLSISSAWCEPTKFTIRLVVAGRNSLSARARPLALHSNVPCVVVIVVVHMPNRRVCRLPFYADIHLFIYLYLFNWQRFFSFAGFRHTKSN